MRRLLAVASAAVVGVLGFGFSTASAAQLPVFAGLQASVTETSACAPALTAGQAVLGSTAGGTGTGGSYSSVALSAVPNACAGLALEVFVHDATGAVIASGSTTAAASTAVPVGTYSATAVDTVVARIGGWVFPTNWTAPAPADPTPPVGPVACYVLDAGGQVVTDAAGNGMRCANNPTLQVGSWGDNVYSTAYLQVQYSVPTTLASVLLVFDFADPRYAGYAGDPTASFTQLTSYNGASSVRPGYSCADRPVFEVVVRHPNTSWGSQTLSGAVQMSSGQLAGAVCSG